MKRRTYRLIEGLLLRVGAAVTALLMLRPQWGRPGDFYLGYPLRFYVTQYDVVGTYISVPALLWDMLVCGVPVYVVVFLLLRLLNRPFRPLRGDDS